MTIDLGRPNRRSFLNLAAGAVTALALPLAGPVSAQSDAARDMLIVNALGGLTDPNPSHSSPDVDPESSRSIERRLIDDCRASGLDAVNQTIGYVAGPGDPFELTMRAIGVWESRFRNHAADLTKVLTAADIERARRDGRIGIILGFQNAAMVSNDVSRIDLFGDFGVRVIQLTYNPANQIGGGSMAPANHGITPFGRQVIDRLNEQRIMVDLSHSGERTCLEAAQISRRPVSINHTGCRALADLPRNKTDEELRLVASRGGFVGIYFMPFLNTRAVAGAADVVDHIDHALNICGEDHVGIGTDGGTTGIDDMTAYRAAMRAEVAQRHASGIGAAGERPDTLPFVEELSGPDQFRRLIALLDRRGYSSARIEKIMGLNFLSYARDVWGS
jgi:membrane dipeptidase